MFFNPLFLNNVNQEGPIQLDQKKMNSTSYLFSDIVKINMEQAELELKKGLSGSCGDEEEKSFFQQLINFDANSAGKDVIDFQLKSLTNPELFLNLLSENETTVNFDNEASSDGDQILGVNEELALDESEVFQFLSNLVTEELSGLNELNSDLNLSTSKSYQGIPTEFITNLVSKLKEGKTLSLEAKVGRQEVKIEISKSNLLGDGINKIHDFVLAKTGKMSPDSGEVANDGGKLTTQTGTLDSANVVKENYSGKIDNKIIDVTNPEYVDESLNDDVDSISKFIKQSDLDDNVKAETKAQKLKNVIVKQDDKEILKTEIFEDKNSGNGNILDPKFSKAKGNGEIVGNKNVISQKDIPQNKPEQTNLDSNQI